MRQRVTVPGAVGVAGPRLRTFSVRLGPLAEPIDAGELDMMLAGLAEMGSLANQSVDNRAGGVVCFDVGLEGSEMDLRSVLSLVVAPEQIAVQANEGWRRGAGRGRDGGAQGHARSGCRVGAGAARGQRDLRRPGRVPARQGAAAGRRAGAAAGRAPRRTRTTRSNCSSRRNIGTAARRRAPQQAAAPAEPAPPRCRRRCAHGCARGSARIAGGEPRAAEAPSGSGYSGGSIRVATEKIDLLVNLVGELVITESMLSSQGALNDSRPGTTTGPGLADLARHTRDLQEMVLGIRMVPISDVFARLPRLVRELSTRLGKRVELTTSGEATELDRGLIEKISDPLNHLVRNCVDHGLETPEARVAAGKPPVGTVSLAASQRGGKVVIEVSDDGRGLDRELILAHAARRGRVLPADAPDAEVWQLLFEAGFSTAEKITDVSGRGVGMDVVRRNILSLGGSVEIASRKGQGLKVTMTVPLTLAIVEAMTVSLGGQIYVLPLAQVVESRSLAPGEIHALPGERETLAVRGAYLPVLRLSKLFPPAQPREQGDAIAVLVEAEGSCAAVLVDALVGQQPVVVKSLETNFRKVPGRFGRHHHERRLGGADPRCGLSHSQLRGCPGRAIR